MVIHQMLGTRISDTLTLQTDCLYRQDGHPMIQIRQMKTTTCVKPISAELELLIEDVYKRQKERRCMILNPKLLIVDDERGIVDMIQSYFQTRYDICLLYTSPTAARHWCYPVHG